MSSAQSLLQKAVQIHKAGQVDEAAKLYRQIIRMDPHNADAFHLLGVVQLSQGQLESAKKNIETAIQFNGKAALFYSNLGNIQVQLGQYEEARQAYEKALRLQPQYPDAQYNLALCLQKMEKLTEAKDLLVDLINTIPQFAKARSALSSVLKSLREYEAGILEAKAAIEIEPQLAEAYTNLGNIHYECGDFALAIENHRRSAELGMRSDIAYSNLGLCYLELGQTAEAEAAFRKSLEENPYFYEAHWNLATCLLSQKKYSEAWPEYLQNWKRPEKKARNLPGQEWNGESCLGEAIYIFAEQGLGDSIQFSRYTASLREQFGFEKIYLGIQDRLKSILEGLTNECVWLKKNQSLPEFHYFSSLPRIAAFFSEIPAPTKLRVDETKTLFWQERFKELDTSLKVGFAWQGNPQYPHDKWRSIPFREFEKLFELKEITWVSLQNSPREAEMIREINRKNVLEFQRELDQGEQAFVDTAALMKNLDMVITSDTSIAHLAGSLGKNTWLLLKQSPDWRWGFHGESCDWYPSLRLFRQSEWGNWNELIARVQSQLKVEVSK